jgi:hypothetical protein
MTLALLFDPKFKDLSIMNNYVGRDMATIIKTRHDSEALIPLLCLIYPKVNAFTKPTKTFVTLK